MLSVRRTWADKLSFIQDVTRHAKLRCSQSHATFQIGFASQLSLLHFHSIALSSGLAWVVQAYVTSERNILQVSYACDSPLLSDAEKYPTVDAPAPRPCALLRSANTILNRILFCEHRLQASLIVQFVRTVSSSISLAPAIAALLGYFRWQRCILLFYQGDAFAATANIWSKALEEKQMIVSPISVNSSQLDRASFPHVVQIIVNLQVRVVLVLGPTDTVRSIALGADTAGIVRAGWVWISDSNAQRAVGGGNTPEVRHFGQ